MPTPSITTTMTAYQWALLVLLSLLWGGSFFFNAVALNELPPLTIVTLRVGLAALTLGMIITLLGLRMPMSLTPWLALAAMAVLNNVVPFVLIVWGQTRLGAGLASILNATTPIFTVIVAGLLLPDERATVAKGVGVVIGLAGVAVLVGTPQAEFEASFVAQLAILGAACCYACAGVYGRRFARLGVTPLVVATGQLTASTLLLLPVTLWVDGIWATQGAGGGTWAALLGLAVLSTALAYVLYFRLLASVGATNLLLVTLLIPVSAILLGTLLLDESLARSQLLGMALIGAGLLAIDGRLWRGVKRGWRADAKAGLGKGGGRP